MLTLSLIPKSLYALIEVKSYVKVIPYASPVAKYLKKVHMAQAIW